MPATDDRINEGTALLKKGDLSSAQAAFYQARDLSGRNPAVMARIAGAWRIAGWTEAMRDGGNPESAWAMFVNARAVYDSLGSSPHAWEVRRGLAVTASMMGEREEALRHCEDAEPLAPPGEPRAKVWNTRAVILSYLGRHEDAEGWAAKALAEAIEEKTRKVARQSLGIARLRQGDPRSAMRMLADPVLHAWAALEAGDPREALALVPGNRPRTFALRARGWLKRGRPAHALREARRGAALVEKGRAALDTDSARAAFAGTHQDAHALLVRLCADRGRWEEAFRHAEAKRARAYLDFVADPRRLDLSHLRPSERTRHEERRKRIEALQRDGGEELRRLEDEEQLALRRYEKERGSRVANQRPVTAAQVRRSLAPHEALVQYEIADDELLAFVLTRSRFTPVRLGKAASILASARDLPRALSLARRDERTGTGGFLDWHFAQLGEALIAPLPLRQVKRLIVVPYGPLHLVPFNSLRVSGGPAIDRYNITLTPSASVWLTLRSQRKSFPRIPKCLFVKDPTGTLPQADAEEAALRRFFRKRLTVLAGDAATREAVVAAAPRHHFLHFATHAVYRADRPGLSYLQLATGTRLTAADVLALDLRRVRTTTLSACDSGRGDWSRAEEMFGLPRAFLRAGVAGVIATLWPLEDHQALGEFAARFCLDGSVQEALRVARTAGAPETLWGAFTEIRE